jgi:hypothetical protein
MRSAVNGLLFSLITTSLIVLGTQPVSAGPQLLIAKKAQAKSAPAQQGGAAEAVKTDAASSAADKPLSVKLISITSPLHPGDDATINVQTAPKSQCEIIVKNKSGNSKAKGLEAKQANNTGKVSWTWKIAKNITPGPIAVTVNCTWGKKTGTLDAKLDVQK